MNEVEKHEKGKLVKGRKEERGRGGEGLEDEEKRMYEWNI